MPHLAIPSQARVYVYAIIGFLSLAVGAFQVGYAALDAPNPDWLTVALAVVPFLAAGLGYTAATHTPAPAQARAEFTQARVDSEVAAYRASPSADAKADAAYHGRDTDPTC